MDVPGCMFRVGVFHLEHGKDTVPDKSPFDEGVGQDEPNAGLLDRPYVGRVHRGVALVKHV